MPEIFVFNHLPRTGGLTFASVLSTWLKPVYDYQSGNSEDARQAWLADPIDLKSLRKGQVLIGHYGGKARLDLRYPGLFENPRIGVLTLVRDAWDVTKSTLCSRAGCHLLHIDSFEDAALKLAGSMARALRVPPLSAAEALTPYWFVGTTERLEESVRLLARRLGVAAPSNLPVTNQGGRLALEHAGQAFERFQRAARMDYELHAAANRRLDADILEHG